MTATREPTSDTLQDDSLNLLDISPKDHDITINAMGVSHNYYPLAFIPLLFSPYPIPPLTL